MTGPRRYDIGNVPMARDDWNRYAHTVGLPRMRLIRSTAGEDVLRLCEDDTGLMIGRKDRRLWRLGIFWSNLRGLSYHLDGARRGDFSPGTPVKLVREPDHPHDPNAVAVYDVTGRYCAAYVNRGRALQVSRVLDSGGVLEAISTAGSGAGVEPVRVSVVAAEPTLLAHLLSSRPFGAPVPVHPDFAPRRVDRR